MSLLNSRFRQGFIFVLLLSLQVDKVHSQENEVKEIRKLTVGVILPLSGKFSKLGETARSAIEFALVESGGAGGIELLIKDSKGEASEATRLAEQLAKSPETAGILGSIGNLESKAVCDAAVYAGISFFSLGKGRQPGASKNCFFLRSSPIRNLEIFLKKIAGIYHVEQKFLAILPDNNFGKARLDEIKEAAKNTGWEIVGWLFYRDDFSGLSEQIKKYANDETSGDKGQKPIHLFFVSGMPFQVRKIKDFVEFYGFRLRGAEDEKGILFLADIIGDYEKALNDPVNSLKGVIFHSLYPLEKLDTNPTIAGYRSRYASKMTDFEMEIFEGAKLFFRCVVEKGIFDREGMMQLINEECEVSGIFDRIEKTGAGIERRHYLYRIGEGKLEELDEKTE